GNWLLLRLPALTNGILDIGMQRLEYGWQEHGLLLHQDQAITGLPIIGIRHEEFGSQEVGGLVRLRPLVNLAFLILGWGYRGNKYIQANRDNLTQYMGLVQANRVKEPLAKVNRVENREINLPVKEAQAKVFQVKVPVKVNRVKVRVNQETNNLWGKIK